MPRKDVRPVIIGVGQCVNRPGDVTETKGVMDLTEEAIRRAEEDSRGPHLAEKVDTLWLANMFSASHRNPPEQLADRLGAHPKSTAYTWVGATAPQWFVNRMAQEIVSGQVRLGLICGGEALYSKKLEVRAAKSEAWDWQFPTKEPWMVGDLRDPVSSLELKYGLMLPIHLYPLFENALRHNEGLSVEEHRQELGRFCSQCSSIAAEHPYAWFRQSRTSDEIVEVSPANRMVAFPYTKSMCSIMEVDQAAALFMTDEETAKELQIPKEKWVYPRGIGDASDIWHVSERAEFYASPSVHYAAEMALEQAQVSIEEIDYFDLYSCFPCAPRMTRNMLGIPKDDPRPLTITGGMPCFGGPGNNYSLHAICSMVELLRREPERTGMVQALSWFISKHSVGVYSGLPGKTPWRPVERPKYQAAIDRIKGPPLVEEASGKAMVETYMVLHDRESRPVSSVIVGRLKDGSRFLARCEPDEETLTALTEQEPIGSWGRVRPRDGYNIFIF